MLKFSSETVSVKLGAKHSWMKAIQVCSNESQCPFPRGDDNIIVEILLSSLKIFFRTTGPFSTKLGTKHPWMRKINILPIRTNGI